MTTITLPTAASRSSYDPLTVKNANGTEVLTISPQGADTVDTTTLRPTEAVTFISDEVSHWTSVWNKSSGGSLEASSWDQTRIYIEGDTVRSGDWTLIAKSQTMQEPNPWLNYADVVQEIADSPSWSSSSVSSSSLWTGNRFTFTSAGIISAIKVWLPAQSGVHYTPLLGRFATATYPAYTRYDDFAPGVSSGWQTVDVGRVVVKAGDAVDVLLQAQNRTGAASFVGDWSYSVPWAEAVPTSGQIVHAGSELHYLRVSKTSSGTTATTLTRVGPGFPLASLGEITDFETELLDLEPGDMFSGGGMTWLVVGTASDQTTYVQIPVAPLMQVTAGLKSFTGIAFTSSSLNYSYLSSYWSGHSSDHYSVQGNYQPSNTSATLNTNAYGTDMVFTPMMLSTDWEFLA